MQELVEIIEVLVKVKINYPDKSRRKEAIKKAEKCTMSASILGSVGCVPKSAKQFKTKTK